MNGPFGLPGFGPIPRFEAREAQGYLPRGWIDGLTLSNDTTDATNDVGIAAGSAKSTVRIVDGTPSTLIRDQIDLELPVSIIKQLDVAFAPENYDPEGFSGTSDASGRSGGRSSSSLSDTTWHALLVGGAGLQTDVVFHDGVTQALVLPELQKIGGYTAYRRIGSVIRSTSVRPFIQFGNEFLLKTPVLDLSAGTIAITSGNFTLTVPGGIKVKARFFSRTTPFGVSLIYYRSPDTTDVAPSLTVAPLGNDWSSSAAASPGAAQLEIWTNTSSQIAARATVATTTSTYIATAGWWDPRDRDT